MDGYESYDKDEDEDEEGGRAGGHQVHNVFHFFMTSGGDSDRFGSKVDIMAYLRKANPWIFIPAPVSLPSCNGNKHILKANASFRWASTDRLGRC